jgi:pyruvate/2-oxoglutarate dehydrogenase complex dihydrolipoamide dehydrogenase (E3) component
LYKVLLFYLFSIFRFSANVIFYIFSIISKTLKRITMIKKEILIIGGGPSAMVAAGGCRQYYPTKSVSVIKKDADSMVPCGIPYVFGTLLNSVEDDMIPCGDMAASMGTELIHDKALKIDTKEKTVTCQSGEVYSYEKLIIATGSTPRISSKIKNNDAEGVFSVPKNPDYIRAMHKNLQDKQKIVVVGTGFIGVEIADELKDSGKDVTLIGPQLLKNSFDEEVSTYMEDIVINRGITYLKNERTSEVLLKDSKACGVLLQSGKSIEADAVILATGYAPSVELAQESGIHIGDFGAIRVDEYMRTNADDVFAVGDCAQKRDFITRRVSPVMLASTATAEARVAAANLYSINIVKSFKGTIGIFSTVMGNQAFGSAGVTEAQAKKEGINYISTVVTVDGKHPASLPNTQQQAIKLIATKAGGVVIGAQIVGGLDAGEMTNMLGGIIEGGYTIFDLIGLQVATHPLLTSAPTTYPVMQAAQNLASQFIGKE